MTADVFRLEDIYRVPLVVHMKRERNSSIRDERRYLVRSSNLVSFLTSDQPAMHDINWVRMSECRFWKGKEIVRHRPQIRQPVLMRHIGSFPHDP